MKTYLFVTAASIAMMTAGAASAQARGGPPVLPPHAMGHAQIPPSIRPPVITPPAPAARQNFGASIAATARSATDGTAVRDTARSMRSAHAGTNANANANADANAGFTVLDDSATATTDVNVDTDVEDDATTDPRSRAQGSEHASDQGVANSANQAQLREDGTDPERTAPAAPQGERGPR